MSFKKIIIKGLLFTILTVFVGGISFSSVAKVNAQFFPLWTPTGSGVNIMGKDVSFSEMCTYKVAPKEMSKNTQEEMTTIITMLIAFEKLMLSLNYPIVWFIGKLMSNDYVYMSGDMQQTLQNLWLLVRNLVNIGFVVVLIAIAFMAVLGVGGGDKGNYEIKKMLPKFIFALIFVNFSFLVCKVILDMGNILTTASFSIVNEVGPNVYDIEGKDYEQLNNKMFCYPKAGYVVAEVNQKTNGNSTPWWNDPAQRTCIGKTIYIGIGKGAEKVCSQTDINWDSLQAGQDYALAFSTDLPQLSSFNARTAMFAYMNNIFRLPEMLKFFNDELSPDSVPKTFIGLFQQAGLAVVYCGILIMINIGMLVAFSVRMVLIWLILIFSPIFALQFVFGAGKMKEIDKYISIKGLISLAVMPAICGFILSMGFLMHKVLMKMLTAETSGVKIEERTLSLMGMFDIKMFGTFLPGFENIQQFILSLIMMVIIWMAIFVTFKTHDMVGKTTEGIRKFGTDIAKLGKDSLKSIPLIPMGPGKKAVSIDILNRTKNKVSSDLSRTQELQTEEFLRERDIPYLQSLASGMKLDPSDKAFLENALKNDSLDEKLKIFSDSRFRDLNTSDKRMVVESLLKHDEVKRSADLVEALKAWGEDKQELNDAQGTKKINLELEAAFKGINKTVQVRDRWSGRDGEKVMNDVHVSSPNNISFTYKSDSNPTKLTIGSNNKDGEVKEELLKGLKTETDFDTYWGQNINEWKKIIPAKKDNLTDLKTLVQGLKPYITDNGTFKDQ